MACQYVYAGSEPMTYEDLLKLLEDEKGLEEMAALLYSKDDSQFQAQLLKKIEIAAKTNKAFYAGKGLINEGSDIKVGSDQFTPQTFIDSAYFNVDGNVDYFRMNRKEYIDNRKRFYKEKLGLSDEQADIRCQRVLEKWDKIGKDSSDAHRILVSLNSNDSERAFMGATLNTSFQNVADQMQKACIDINKNIRERLTGSNWKVNLNIEAKIKNLAESMVGHIDYLAITPDGEIEIFNLKVSTDAEPQWDEVKKEKFRYQLAFIKKILEHNGIHARNIRMNLVPVHIEYDENFENVINVTANDYVSYDMKNGKYIFQKYEATAAEYIDSNDSEIEIDDRAFINVNDHLRKIFPDGGVDVAADGVKESAKGWVRKNWKRIAQQAVNKKGWNIRLPGEKEAIYVADTRIGDKNEEVINLVQDKEEELFGNIARAKTTHRIVTDIKRSYENKHPFIALSTESDYNKILKRQLNKYLEEVNYGKDGEFTYRWELIDNQTLFNANILMFKNHDTHQLDIVTLTPFEVDVKTKVKGRDNLLGFYLPDLNSNNFTMESNYGNIEAVRSMVLLNEILPKLGDVKLGNLKIVSLSGYHQKSGRDIMIGQLLPQFATIMRVVKGNNEKFSMENNFQKENITAIDPSKLVVQAWREVVTEFPDSTKEVQTNFKDIIVGKTEVDGTVVDGLETVDNIEGKIEKLKQLISAIKSYNPSIANASVKELIEYSKDPQLQVATTAKIYMAALRALNIYNGDLSIDNEDFSRISEIFAKPQSIPNTNVRTVAYMFQRSIDRISGQMLDRYSPIRKKFLKFLEQKGYTAVDNSIIGNHAAQFKHLYEVDNESNLTMRFKNPYDMSTDLESYERDFLKDILWELNKIRFEMKGLDINKEYTGPEDSKLIEKINKGDINYLDVPLMRMSKHTRHENLVRTWKETGRRMLRAITHPKDAFQQFGEDMLNNDEKRQRDQDIERLQAYNPFLRSEMSINSRNNYINEKGTDFFEYDLETIMVNFMEKHVQSVEFNKMLTRTKGILLDLEMRGIAEDDIKGVEHTVKTIEDYLSVSVYNKSIMEDATQAIEAFLMPIRRAVTTCYVAANPVGMVRDISEGIKQNMVKALIKFQTDITPQDVLYGYKSVIEEGPQNIMSITKMNQLNLKYRFSNLDIARISEGLKTSGSGVLNADNWAYLTLRSPDYLNRMVLFSAKMHHDGVEDAYYIKDGQLVYDWTLDKRFQVYLDPDGYKNNPEEYNKQRSKYLSLLRQFNKEGRLFKDANNPEGRPFKEGDALPDAYTEQQIATFKNFSDNIYGSYNQSTRSKYEHMAAGRQLGIFSTWMNGIVDVYAKEKQISLSETREEQEVDANGNLLFFDKDGKVVTTPTDTKVLNDVPIMVQGVINTIHEFIKEWHFNSLDEAIKQAWTDNDVNRRNLRRALSDLIMMALYGAIYKLALDPAYQEFKKQADGRNIVRNALIEITYKGGHNSWDGFFGPFSVLDYIGNSTNPATYKLPTKAINDLLRFSFGDQTLYGTILGYSALTRSFRDSYRMYVRDTQ